MNDSHPPFSSQQVLDFWFGAPDSPEYGQPRKVWFANDPDFDAEIRKRFGGLHQAASHGMLDHFWKDVALPNLALVITLDQFSRQLYRGEAKAFAQDAHALQVARHAVDEGFDRDAFLKFVIVSHLHLSDQSLCLKPSKNANYILHSTIWSHYSGHKRNIDEK